MVLSLRPALTVTAILLAALMAAPAGAAPGRPIMVGAAEDAAKQGPLEADAKMSLARLAGFNTIRMTSLWWPGNRQVSGTELEGLRNAADAARLNGIRLIISVYPNGSKTTPLTPTARAQFASYTASIPQLVPYVRDVIVGNEPNLNRFWMPQFTATGENAAASSYMGLLAQTYDQLKAVSPKITVIGGTLAPRGSDKPTLARATHSPTQFILDMGAAYRRSGRTRPVMDWFSFHPYLEKSSIPPTFAHPKVKVIALADYGKLTRLLGKAFDGTAQPGSTLPILYDEFGVQTHATDGKRSLYTNEGLPSAGDAVDEATQARYYTIALRFAACQKNVVGLLFFHVSDEADLDRWQSGVYYADDTPKSSLAAVRTAAEAARAGKLGSSCPR
jgi:hypothetical protein